jgi:hypothetical protein
VRVIAKGPTKARQPLTLPSREELIRRVNLTTYRQVENLDIDCRGTRVRVSGQSQTYYVKQLVTQAILSSVPTAELENEVLVQA